MTEFPGVYTFVRRDDIRGTCFVVEYKGQQFLVTARHLVSDGSRFFIGYQGENIDIVVGAAGIMSGYDIAVMQISGAPHVLKIAPDKIEGARVYALGYTTLTTVRRSTGRIVGNRNYITKAELQSGMSGGPLLNARGEVIGVNSARQTQPDHTTYLVSHHADIRHAIRIMDNLIKMEAEKKAAEQDLEAAKKAAKAALERAAEQMRKALESPDEESPDEEEE